MEPDRSHTLSQSTVTQSLLANRSLAKYSQYLESIGLQNAQRPDAAMRLADDITKAFPLEPNSSNGLSLTALDALEADLVATSQHVAPLSDYHTADRIDHYAFAQLQHVIQDITVDYARATFARFKRQDILTWRLTKLLFDGTLDTYLTNYFTFAEGGTHVEDKVSFVLTTLKQAFVEDANISLQPRYTYDDLYAKNMSMALLDKLTYWAPETIKDTNALRRHLIDQLHLGYE